MGTQRELFETNRTKRVETVWLSIPTAVRQEISAILARMGRAAVGGKKQTEAGKEVSDE